MFGSGAIGIEFASFYAAFGVKTTVVELLDRVLPVEDEEISAFAKKRFEKEGLKLLTSTEAKSLKATANGVEAVVSAKRQGRNADRLARHRRGRHHRQHREPRPRSARRENRSRPHRHRRLRQDQRRRPLRHRRRHRRAVARAQSEPRRHHLHRSHRRQEAAPDDQGAHSGLHLLASASRQRRPHRSEGESSGRDVRVGRFPFVGNGKAIALGEDQGMVKVVFDAKTGELLGAHMIGAEVTELIQGFAVAMTAEVTEETLMETVFPHPTLSEMMHESVLDAYGRVLHV